MSECVNDRCDRPAALNPPYCCVPCEVATRGGAPLHSSRCDTDNTGRQSADLNDAQEGT